MLSKRYDNTIEEKWQHYWKDKKAFKFDVSKDKPAYSLDTPPPFTSGTLHLGHVFNHVWIDVVARYKRMKGFNVYLPQGFDCHGLPTELRVEKEFGVKKENRDEFLKKCHEWTEKAITRMKSQFDMLGYSTDWSDSYRTMEDDYKAMVQKTLLDFYGKGMLYRAKHPVLWCCKCGTALAKAEAGYVEMPGKLYHIDLDVGVDNKFTIATTRPEMMPSCVAVIVHPDDKRYKAFVGKKAKLPVFNREVPIISDDAVDKDFGTGVVYLCTFGDEQDIAWQKKYKLPIIVCIDEKGFMTKEAGKYAGMTIKDARKAITEDLTKDGKVRKVEEFNHNVLCHTERSACNTPIELLPLEQWFIKVKDYLGDINKAADKMSWYPGYMKQRLNAWTESMDWDWIISRQRVFGTPIPFWVCKCGEIIKADGKELPIDPRGTTKKCPECGGEARGEIDVCDCWVDSSITPLRISKWGTDEAFFSKTYPASLRPQGYEIIRTWTFYTIFRDLILTGQPCFKDLMINGMVCGPDGRKMSKSFGNVIEPETVLEKYCTDAIRQWASSGTLGEDYPFSWDECEHSQKFLTKLWNVSRFIENHLKDYKPGKKPKLRETDKWILSKLQRITENANNDLDRYVFNLPLQQLRTFIWHDLADYYLEMVKHRLYKPDIYGDESRYAAQYALHEALSTCLLLLHPFVPHITEELHWNMFEEKSMLEEEYPQPKNALLDKSAEETGELLVNVVDQIRKYKTDNSMSLGAELEGAKILVPDADKKKILEEVEEDIRGTGRIPNLSVEVDKSREDVEVVI